jgi:hypothetical protein
MENFFSEGGFKGQEHIGRGDVVTAPDLLWTADQGYQGVGQAQQRDMSESFRPETHHNIKETSRSINLRPVNAQITFSFEQGAQRIRP